MCPDKAEVRDIQRLVQLLNAYNIHPKVKQNAGISFVSFLVLVRYVVAVFSFKEFFLIHLWPAIVV